jgi:hypothetical protein
VSTLGTQLDALLAAIPIAQDDNVITRDYHNSLRAAILELAGQIGAGPGDRATTVTFAPTFLRSGSSRIWIQGNGFAAKEASADSADGWMQIQLPNGLRIKSLTIIGDKKGNVGEWSVQMLRQQITSTTSTVLLSVNLEDSPDTFNRTEPITSTANQIDNQTYKYLITAKIIGSDTAATTTARMLAFQVVCES